ncbi:MAG TPA: hypothetical protein VER79_00205 [Candidatus Limnocylindrales bacterium]|nr:hypothetical protein [Candidatus Limnocylindrales bacterium]
MTKAMRQFTAIIEFDPDTAQYVGIVPGVTGAHAQADTLDELRVNLKEVLELCLEELGEPADGLPVFIGTQLIEVSI